MRKPRPQPEWMKIPRTCARPECKRKQFYPRNKRAIYCCDYCRNRMWRDMNPRVFVPLRRLANGRVQITLEIPAPARVA